MSCILVLIHYFEKYFETSFFILKAFCSTLNSRIGKLVNSILNVTNRANEFQFSQVPDKQDLEEELKKEEEERRRQEEEAEERKRIQV